MYNKDGDVEWKKKVNIEIFVSKKEPVAWTSIQDLGLLSSSKGLDILLRLKKSTLPEYKGAQLPLQFQVQAHTSITITDT